MKKALWIPVVIGTLLLAAGVVITVTSLPKQKSVETAYDFSGKEIKSILMDLSISDVNIKVGNETKVVCKESEKWHHTVIFNEESKSLDIKFDVLHKWYEFSSVFSPNFEIQLYLPEGDYDLLKIDHSTGSVNVASGFTFSNLDIDGSTGDISVKSSVTGKAKISQSTGDVSLNDTKVGELALEVTTGKLNLNNVEVAGNANLRASTGKTTINNFKCNNLEIKASTGDVKMNNSIALGKAKIQTSTGDIELNDFDASEVQLEADTGSVDAVFLSIKDVKTSTDTEKIKVDPELNKDEGGNCSVKTDTGHIYLSLKK